MGVVYSLSLPYFPTLLFIKILPTGMGNILAPWWAFLPGRFRACIRVLLSAWRLLDGWRIVIIPTVTHGIRVTRQFARNVQLFFSFLPACLVVRIMAGSATLLCHILPMRKNGWTFGWLRFNGWVDAIHWLLFCYYIFSIIIIFHIFSSYFPRGAHLIHPCIAYKIIIIIFYTPKEDPFFIHRHHRMTSLLLLEDPLPPILFRCWLLLYS